MQRPRKGRAAAVHRPFTTAPACRPTPLCLPEPRLLQNAEHVRGDAPHMPVSLVSGSSAGDPWQGSPADTSTCPSRSCRDRPRATLGASAAKCSGRTTGGGWGSCSGRTKGRPAEASKGASAAKQRNGSHRPVGTESGAPAARPPARAARRIWPRRRARRKTSSRTVGASDSIRRRLCNACLQRLCNGYL